MERFEEILQRIKELEKEENNPEKINELKKLRHEGEEILNKKMCDLNNLYMGALQKNTVTG